MDSSVRPDFLKVQSIVAMMVSAANEKPDWRGSRPVFIERTI
jgi:hypothetical protein